MCSLYLVTSTEFSLKQGAKFRFYKLFAQGGYAVNKHMSVQVVKFMLHYPCEVAIHPFIVLVEFVIQVCYMYARRANHVLVYSWQR